MPLTKGELEAIEDILRLAIAEELEGMTKGFRASLSALDARLSGIESNIESLRDALSG